VTSCWYNFCHSSTRFFVEEVFGRWKNKWRFLLSRITESHELAVKMIYASMILHNMCTIHAGEADGREPLNTQGKPDWDKFHNDFKAHVCPGCAKRKVGHCVHVAKHRNGGTVMHNNICAAPSAMRDTIRDALFARLEEGVLDGMSVDDSLLWASEGLSAQDMCEMRRRVSTGARNSGPGLAEQA
jgi:hypothetical protein